MSVGDLTVFSRVALILFASMLACWASASFIPAIIFVAATRDATDKEGTGAYSTGKFFQSKFLEIRCDVRLA